MLVQKKTLIGTYIDFSFLCKHILGFQTNTGLCDHMNTKKSRHLLTSGFYSTLCISLFSGPFQIDIMPWTNGVGTRALGLGGNYVSESGDLSGLLWNPAGIAQKKTNEFTITGDWLRLRTSRESERPPADNCQTIRLNGLGAVGFSEEYPGVSTGLGFQKVYSFDNFHQIEERIVQNGDSFNVQEMVVSRGGLDFWSLDISLPLSKKFFIGSTISYVHGIQNILVEANSSFAMDGSNKSESYTSKTQRVYKGYDLRFGFLYQPGTWFRTGGRLVVPATINVAENSQYKLPGNDSTVVSKRKGQLHTSLSGAVGASLVMLSTTFTGELRFRAPYNYFDIVKDSMKSSASDWNNGAGVGIEFSPAPIPIIFRTGYSLDKIDPYLLLIKYIDNSATDNQRPAGKQRTISGGIGIVISPQISINSTYVFSLYDLKYPNGYNEKRTNQRVLIDLSILY